MTEISDKGKILEAFQLIYKKTGKTEATMPELISALREINPMLRNRSNAFIRKMIKSNSPDVDDITDRKEAKKK